MSFAEGFIRFFRCRHIPLTSPFACGRTGAAADGAVRMTVCEAKVVRRRRAAWTSAQGRMVIDLGRSRRVVVGEAVDAEALTHVLDALDRR